MDNDIIESLEDLFDDLSIDNPTTEQLHKMYGIYLNDFVNSPLLYNERLVVIDKSIIKHKREGYFINKQKSFDHIVTRENLYSKKRCYDRNRANKIHWIKQIIENHSNRLIKEFERIDQYGYNCIFLWLESKKHIVILREKQPDLYFVTGYCVDNSEQIKFKKYYEEYKHKKTSLRK